MITLLTSLFVGLYWLFTNIVLLPSLSTQNSYNIFFLGMLEITTELMFVIFITALVKTLKKEIK